MAPASSSVDLMAALAIQSGSNIAHFLSNAASQLELATRPLPVGFPPGPASDMALEMAGNPLAFMERMKAGYGNVVGLKIAGNPVVLLSSPKLTREVLITQGKIFIKAGTAFFPDNSIAGNGLLVSDGDIWRRQRRLSNPAFCKASVEAYAQTMVEATYHVIENKWKNGEVRNISIDLNELALEIVVTALFGASKQEDTTEVISSISTAFKHFMKRATSMFIIPEWFPTIDNMQFNRAVSILDQVVYQMIADRRSQLASTRNTNANRCDLLARLLEARDTDGTGMDDRSLRDELMTLIIAGQETSSSLLSWSLIMLAHHEDIQEKLHSELAEVLGTRQPTYMDVEKLNFTRAILMETMRLHPPAYLIGRCASETTCLDEWKIPAGTTILMSLYLLHRDPLYWPRALDFHPNRWLNKKRKYIDNDSYWPFGGGQRNCIGADFAMMESCLVICIIISRYRVSFTDGSSVPRPQAMITLRPESPVYLKLSPR